MIFAKIFNVGDEQVLAKWSTTDIDTDNYIVMVSTVNKYGRERILNYTFKKEESSLKFFNTFDQNSANSFINVK